MSYNEDTKTIYRTFKEKNLEQQLEQLIENRFTLNSHGTDIITTIPAPQISADRQTLPLSADELLDFYKKFQSKSHEYTNKLIINN